jgi:hypothetical protein
MTKLTENEIIDLISQYQSSIKKLDFQKNAIRETVKELQQQLKETQKANREAAKAAAAKAKAAANKKEKPATTKKVGRPAKKSETTPVAKAPVKKAASKPATQTPEEKAPAASAEKKTTVKAPAKPTAKKRGRPRKNFTDTAAKIVSETADKPVTKKRGRPRKNAVDAPVAKTPAKKSAPKKKAPAQKPATGKAPGSNGKRGYKLSEWDELILDGINANAPMTRQDIEKLVADKGKTLSKDMNEKQVAAKISNVLHKLANTKKLVTKGKNADKKPAYSPV